MPHFTFPYIEFRDDTGMYYAMLLEWEEPAAMGRSARDAVSDLRAYLRWQYERSWMSEPELEQCRLESFSVRLRPAYQVEQRRFPLSHTIKLQVPTVLGRLGFGGRVAILPTLNERIQYHESDDVKSLVQFVVQSALDGSTPQTLSRCQPPHDLRLGTFSFHVSDKDRGYREPPSPPNLSNLADPLGARQSRAALGKAWQRDQEVQQLTRRLQQAQTNVLLVGATGVGKSTVLVNAVRECERDWARRAKDGGSDEHLQRHRFWQTSAGRLIAGMRYLGQWEARMEAVIEELNSFDGFLCVESLADFVQTGGQGADSGLAAFCMPFIQRRELRVVAEATPAELDACRRLLPGFDDLFQVQVIEPMETAASIDALAQHGTTIARREKIDLDAREVAAATVHLHERFLPYQSLPGEASRFLHDALQQAQKNSTVTLDDIQREFIERTGLDYRFVDANYSLQRSMVETALQADVMGQDHACRAVGDVVLRFKAGLSDPQRPLGVLLFCGPTGVGKTELARSLGRYLFGGGHADSERTGALATEHAKERFIRLDMSEYSGPLAAERLQRQTDGTLSPFLQQVRRHPFSVILLDEVEKAHPAVYDVLLNVFDEGRMTDEFGRVTYFRNAVIIMTSNLGAQSKADVGFDTGAGANDRKYLSAVRDFFRPEFFNRMDGVIPFAPLSKSTIHRICERELTQIAAREGLRRRRISLHWTAAVVQHLAALGYDRRYGARPLQRTIETAVVDRLSRWLTENLGAQDLQLDLSVDSGGGLRLVVANP